MVKWSWPFNPTPNLFPVQVFLEVINITQFRSEKVYHHHQISIDLTECDRLFQFVYLVNLSHYEWLAPTRTLKSATKKAACSMFIRNSRKRKQKKFILKMASAAVKVKMFSLLIWIGCKSATSSAALNLFQFVPQESGSWTAPAPSYAALSRSDLLSSSFPLFVFLSSHSL